MVQHELSMRSETLALEAECQRLQLLVGELLLKNHQLRCEVARLRDVLDAQAPQAKKGHRDVGHPSVFTDAAVATSQAAFTLTSIGPSRKSCSCG